MIIACDWCGKQGTIEEQSYSGKKVRLRCPYCFKDFVFSVPQNGHSSAAASDEAAFEGLASREDSPGTGVASPLIDSEASDALILEAKRIARLIISEIKLYNHDKIEKAGSKREILDLLKTDLMRGKQHYNNRIAAKLPTGPDYFMETVKEILLAGKE